MINIRTTQRSQTRESLVRTLYRDLHGLVLVLSGQLTHIESGVGYAADGNLTLVPGPTLAEQATIPNLVHQQVTGMLQLYQQ